MRWMNKKFSGKCEENDYHKLEQLQSNCNTFSFVQFGLALLLWDFCVFGHCTEPFIGIECMISVQRLSLFFEDKQVNRSADDDRFKKKSFSWITYLFNNLAYVWIWYYENLNGV